MALSEAAAQKSDLRTTTRFSWIFFLDTVCSEKIENIHIDLFLHVLQRYAVFFGHRTRICIDLLRMPSGQFWQLILIERIFLSIYVYKTLTISDTGGRN